MKYLGYYLNGDHHIETITIRFIVLLLAVNRKPLKEIANHIWTVGGGFQNEF